MLVRLHANRWSPELSLGYVVSDGDAHYRAQRTPGRRRTPRAQYSQGSIPFSSTRLFNGSAVVCGHALRSARCLGGLLAAAVVRDVDVIHRWPVQVRDISVGHGRGYGGALVDRPHDLDFIIDCEM